MTNNGIVISGGTVTIGAVAVGAGASANSASPASDVLERLAALEAALHGVRQEIPAEIEAAMTSFKAAVQAQDQMAGRQSAEKLLKMVGQFNTLAAFADRIKAICGYFL